MSPPIGSPNEEGKATWAPVDYTDGKKKGEWQSSYPPEARKRIRLEVTFLVCVLVASLAGVLWIVFQACEAQGSGTAGDAVQGSRRLSPMFLGFLGSCVSGMLGGCCFGLKCMYHFVAKQMWHEDRRLWRMLAPVLSGVVALFAVLLVSSGLLQIFDKTLVESPIRVVAFSCLVGYFSDKALAKMADVADTLFGGTGQVKGRGGV